MQDPADAVSGLELGGLIVKLDVRGINLLIALKQRFVRILNS
ncbi:MAG: hypothetical protein R3C68_03735 [Myxococcota bacterium]